MPKDNQTREVLLLTYSEHLSGHNLKELEAVLMMMVVKIDGKLCMVGSIRIDEAEHKIYGRGHEIPTYGQYK